ncbi:MAG: proteasome accessory factor PafA2 family protein, partial [Armatimonadota bacterium]|nr:proteasome accessory factor PafA2 family protein [Armatimonadota bacterium]
LEAAQQHLAGADDQVDWVLREWEETLDLLEKDPMSLADRLDWVAKRQMLETYMAEEGVGWHADVLQSLDLEYHNINPKRSLYHALVEMGAMRRVTTDRAIEEATRQPPRTSRALGRSKVIRQILARRIRRYAIDWDSVYVDQNLHLDLPDPFHTYQREAERFANRLR